MKLENNQFLLLRVMLLVFVCLSFVSSQGWGAIYTYVDENGMNHFTNIVPEGKKFRVVITLPSWEGSKPPMPRMIKREESKPSDVFSSNAASVYIVLAAPSEDDFIKLTDRIAIGSAVAVSSRQLLTNCHLFDNRNWVIIKQADNIDRASVVFSDRKSDRCYIKTDKISVKPVKGVRPYDSLRVGERVYSIGSPRGLENTLGEGIISGLRFRDGVHMIQTSAPISPGSSGGGLFDSRGNLIGITTLFLRESQNVNFAISAEEFWK